MFHRDRHSRTEPTLERPDSIGPPPEGRCCEADDCQDEGVYRAPKSRHQLREYRWFCLEHVRAYNKRWNYYAGLSENEVEAEIRRSTTWERPSWPFGASNDRHSLAHARMRDGFGFFEGADAAAGPHRHEGPRPQGPDAQAFAIMGLEPPITMASLRQRYRELVKTHHPDANGGDKAAEERLKLINGAYTTLKRFLS